MLPIPGGRAFYYHVPQGQSFSCVLRSWFAFLYPLPMKTRGIFRNVFVYRIISTDCQVFYHPGFGEVPLRTGNNHRSGEAIHDRVA